MGPVGPANARILLIGEAWGAEEEKKGVPFIGMAGKVLDGILEEAGIKREEVAITNVIHERPPGNNFSIYYEKVGGKIQPTGKLLEAYERLKNEIVSISPNVIVPLGNEPMKAILGHPGITDWRGSVLETPFGKVIPTIHPAAILREWTFRQAVVSDFRKIRHESENQAVTRTPRNLQHTYDINTVRTWLDVIANSEKVAFDIETESGQICCIAFATSPVTAYCIPFWFKASGSLWSKEEEYEIWSKIQKILEAPRPLKVTQNGMYDIEFIKRTVGIDAHTDFDTMYAFHCLYSEQPKSLAYLTSLYTDHPYYKYQLRTEDMEVFWRYNATDAALTFEIGEKLLEELRESKLEDFYRAHVHSLVGPLLRMQERGVLFDTEERNKLRKEYRQRLDELQTQLESQVGYELNTASSPQMTKFLYEELKLPPKYAKRADGKKTLSADEEALGELFKLSSNPAIKTILDIREITKIYTTYLGVVLDADKRIRCGYLITGTETGRLSSRATARGTGTNLQNIPGGVVKSLFKSDPGRVLINADLSQAEARVVAYLAGDERLIRVFESGGDIHRKNAGNIFGKQESEVTDDERQMAKRVVHASNYGMGPRTFARTAGIPEKDSRRLLAQYFATYPRVALWQTRTQDCVKRTRRLSNPFGRNRIFFNRWSESLGKEGLAFIPQSTVADLINIAVIELDKRGYELLLQVHDSIVLQVEESRVAEAIAEIKSVMEIPININGRTLVIPVDCKIGTDWENMSKWKARS